MPEPQHLTPGSQYRIFDRPTSSTKPLTYSCTMDADPSQSPSPESQSFESSSSVFSSNADGNLLVLLTGGFYGLFTFLSTNQTIVWPWAALWQAALILPMVWLLWQLWYKSLSRFRLGNGFDWLAAIALLGLVLSTLVTQFHQPAVWYAIGGLSGLAALYGLMGWLTAERRLWLLKAQGYLALAFIVSSLGQWFWRLYRPEVARVEALSAYSIDASLNLNVLGLRNWFPLGHQNYVAGYLILVLPLILGLALTAKNWQRWIWWGGGLLGLVTLYTTHSRGGTLALLSLLVPLLLGVILFGQISRRVWLPILLGGVALMSLLIVTNPRLSNSLMALSQGNVTGGGITYRVITNLIGWRMGQQLPWAGLGVGSAPLLFQRYRPFWAGREAELHYQLHSTPAQLWGELGVWGGVLPFVAAGLLMIILWRQRSLVLASERSPAIRRWSLLSGLWGYGILSLTDYQLDVIPIVGIIVIYLAVLLFDLRPPAPSETISRGPSRQRSLVFGGIGLLLAMMVWLVPLHRAWANSAAGFVALEKGNPERFVVDLEQSHALAPGEAYYPLILGWVLGDISVQVNDLQTTAALKTEAAQWFRIANEISPYQEFGHSSLGWLELPDNPQAAIAQFAQSTELVPAKQGVFYGLGYSLFLNNQPDLAAAAIALEMLRNPGVLTQRSLNIGELRELLPAITEHAEAWAGEILENTSSQELTRLLAEILGTLHWWNDDLAAAEEAWAIADEPISLAVLATAQGQTPDLETLPAVPGKWALKAWQDPANRRQWLEAAWLEAEVDSRNLPQLQALQPPEAQIDALLDTMNEATTFDQWLKEFVLYIRLRSERIGFGVLMRHDDGPSPSDFYIRWENLAMSRFFERLLPSPAFMFELDAQLQPYRDDLLQKLAP
ncbi:MAG: O-antigen ligase family protein [Leptolyngbya sp. SIOISBB]|nr:O-antigen ligase family protein [Leptolyngbya sp. SIOISBB]